MRQQSFERSAPVLEAAPPNFCAMWTCMVNGSLTPPSDNGANTAVFLDEF